MLKFHLSFSTNFPCAQKDGFPKLDHILSFAGIEKPKYVQHIRTYVANLVLI